MDNQNDPLDIVVLGYPPRYVAAVRKLLGTEGGYANDPVDRGGATNFGISLRFLRAEGRTDLDMDGDIDGADVRALTKGQAVLLYYRCFWQRYDCAEWPAPIGEMLFDQAVNGGATAARKLLQSAINACLAKQVAASALSRPLALKVDGQVGPLTRAAFDWCVKWASLGMPALTVAYREAAADRYRNIAAADRSQGKYLVGWLHRAAALGR